MGHPEYPAMGLVIQKFDTAIYGVRDAGVAGISDRAELYINKIGHRQTPVVMGRDFHTPAIINFDTLQARQRGTTMYHPVFAINPDKVLGAPFPAVQAEIVRTIAVADTFPLEGYENRLVDSYSKALETQKEWLTGQNVEPIPLDPRTENKEDILKTLLGKRYYSDSGFADWQAAIDELVKDGRFPQDRLQTLRSDKATFLTYRETYQEMTYDTAMRSRSEEYLALTPHQRARASSAIYISLALHPQPTQN